MDQEYCTRFNYCLQITFLIANAYNSEMSILPSVYSIYAPSKNQAQSFVRLFLDKSNCASLSKRVLSAVSNVQKSILVFLILIDWRHQSSCRRQYVVDEQIDRLFWVQLDPLSYDTNELAHRQVFRNQILLLVNLEYITSWVFLTNHLEKKMTMTQNKGLKKMLTYRDSIRVLLPNSLCFMSSLLWNNRTTFTQY